MKIMVQMDDSYKKWLGELSERFNNSQIKAEVRVNSEMLRFYWSLGRDISRMEFAAKYGSGFYKKLSADLKELFPGVGAFSETNLRYVVWFYNLYSEIPQQPVVKFEST